MPDGILLLALPFMIQSSHPRAVRPTLLGRSRIPGVVVFVALLVLLCPPTSVAAQVKVIGEGSWAFTGGSILPSGSVARNEYRYRTQAACQQGRQTAIHNSRQGLQRAKETLQRLSSGAIYWNREEQRQKAEFDKRFYSTLLNSLSGCARIAAGGAAGLANPGASTVPTGPTNAEIAEAVVAGAELVGAIGEAFFGSPEERAAAARELRAARRRNSEHAKSAFEGIDPYAEEGGVGCVDLSADDQTCEGWDGIWSSDSWKGAGEDGMVDCFTLDGRPCSEADLDPFELKGDESDYSTGVHDDDGWKGPALDDLNAPNCSADPRAFGPEEQRRWAEHCGRDVESLPERRREPTPEEVLGIEEETGAEARRIQCSELRHYSDTQLERDYARALRQRSVAAEVRGLLEDARAQLLDGTWYARSELPQIAAYINGFARSLNGALALAQDIQAIYNAPDVIESVEDARSIVDDQSAASAAKIFLKYTGPLGKLASALWDFSDSISEGSEVISDTREGRRELERTVEKYLTDIDRQLDKHDEEIRASYTAQREIGTIVIAIEEYCADTNP